MSENLRELCKLAGFTSLKAFADAHCLNVSTVYAWSHKGIPRTALWYLDERRKRLYYENIVNELRRKVCGKEESKEG